MSDGFVPVAKAEELSPGQMRWVAVNGERLVLANVEGVLYALSDVCGHRKDRKSTRLNSSHSGESRMPSSA